MALKSIAILVAAISFLFPSLDSAAMPILSADGSRLSGLEIDGEIYDVFFGDGVVGEVFPTDRITQPDWFALAQSVSAGVESALVSIAAIDALAPTDIAGCEWHYSCTLFLADEYRAGLRFPVYDNQPATLCGDLSDPVCNSDVGSTVMAPVWDTHSSFFDGVTLVTFEQVTDVPAPSSLTLMALGLLLIPYCQPGLRKF